MNIEIFKSKRKSIAIEIKPDLRVIVRAPIGMRKRDIKRFIEEKSEWINKNLEVAREIAETKKQVPKFTASQISKLKADAKLIIPQRAEYFANLMCVTYNHISVKSQSTRWGSCSSLKNLNFNCVLLLCPQAVLDYVIIHELCHLKEMNHSKKFWAEVKHYCPDYENCKKWLKTEGSKLISRI